MIIFQDIIKS